MFKPLSVESLLVCHHPLCQEEFWCWEFLILVTCVPEMCPRSTARLSCCFITTSQAFLKEHNFFGASTKHPLLGGGLEGFVQYSSLKCLLMPRHGAGHLQRSEPTRTQPAEQHVHAQAPQAAV